MKHRTVCTQCAAGPVPVAHGVGSVGREPESSRLQAALTGLPEGDRWGHGGVCDTSKPEGSAVWSCRLLPGLLCLFLLLMLSKVGTDGGQSVAVMPLACCVTAAAFMGLPLGRQEVFCHPKAMERGNAMLLIPWQCFVRVSVALRPLLDHQAMGREASMLLLCGWKWKTSLC